MTSLASIDPDRHSNRDKHPWVSASGERLPFNGRTNRPGEKLEWRPRPEFDPVTPAHDFNPILDDFREFRGIAGHWLDYLASPDEQTANGEDWTKEQVEHATAVLTRYRGICENGSNR